MTFKKKLIEVALPLEAINLASAREKSIRHGHPSTLHLWWARRPLAAARAVIFAQMVDDPSTYLDVLRGDSKLVRKAETLLKSRMKIWDEATTLSERAKGTSITVPEPGPKPTLEEILADQERQRLFRIIEDLVKWESTNDEKVLQAARDEILQSWRRTCAENAGDPAAKELFDRQKMPAFHDPFAGGGALPLEAQRLGLESYASDLNPVAVLINKAMIEIPPKFKGQAPVNPSWQSKRDDEKAISQWSGAQGLAEDVRYYGRWTRDEAEKRIGHLYPKALVTEEVAKERSDLKEYVGRELPVVAWIWVRTVKSPNPAFSNVDVPLASTFMLSIKTGREAYVEPLIENGRYRFATRVGKPRDERAAKNGTKLSRANFSCVMSGAPISGDYIKAEGKAGRMGVRLMAIVADGDRGRVFLPPTPDQEAVAHTARPTWKPETAISGSSQYLGVKPYGMDRFDQLFTDRQHLALTTFSDLIQEVCELARKDGVAAGMYEDSKRLDDGGGGATAYGEAIAVYLAFALDKVADRGSTLGRWDPTPTQSGIINTFSRQALSMTWDFAESNPIGGASGNFTGATDLVAKALLAASPNTQPGIVGQEDAATQTVSLAKVISTDPPYYDNVPYADLSDYFYVWLRRSLRSSFPSLFSTLVVPKADELVAFAYRHDGKAGAEAFFLSGMTRAMHRLAEQAHPTFPVTIYYAFKQAESDDAEGRSSTGWETFLDAVIGAGFAISGTWPMRTELGTRMRSVGSNALASSIVLVCRKRNVEAAIATRREFISALKTELPGALAHLQRGNIAPVDLAQAAIGPGMAVYTRYSKVVDAQGKSLHVREALTLINQTLDESLAEQEGDFDADSRWALTWFEQVGFEAGEYGVANVLAQAKNTSVDGMVQAGIVASKAGKVRLLKADELPDDWDPATDTRLTAWEVVHQLIRVLNKAGGESAAAKLLAKLGAKAEVARELAYRLYTLCERKKRAEDALAYNGLVQSWPEIARIAQDVGRPTAPTAIDMFDERKE